MLYGMIKETWQQKEMIQNFCKKFNYKWQRKPWKAA